MRVVKKNKQTPFLVKLMSFLIILIFLDFAFGSLLKHFYFKQQSGILYRTTYAIDSTKAEMLIFGSSTANHHYIPDSFSEAFHISCYNTGRDGNSIFYSYAVLQGILKRYTPKMIILDMYDQAFMKEQSSYDRISSLLPYYNTNPEVRSIIQLKSPFEKYKLLSKIYPFNSMLFTIGIGNADFNKGREDVMDQNGYVPLTETWKKPLGFDTTLPKYEIDSNKVKFFKSFIIECNTSNIELYIVLSPKFIKYKYEDSTIGIVNRIAQEFKIPFYNFTNDSFFLSNQNLFFDRDHLNEEGAKIFTGRVINKIKAQK